MSSRSGPALVLGDVAMHTSCSFAEPKPCIHNAVLDKLWKKNIKMNVIYIKMCNNIYIKQIDRLAISRLKL